MYVPASKNNRNSLLCWSKLENCMTLSTDIVSLWEALGAYLFSWPASKFQHTVEKATCDIASMTCRKKHWGIHNIASFRLPLGLFRKVVMPSLHRASRLWATGMWTWAEISKMTVQGLKAPQGHKQFQFLVHVLYPTLPISWLGRSLSKWMPDSYELCVSWGICVAAGEYHSNLRKSSASGLQDVLFK